MIDEHANVTLTAPLPGQCLDAVTRALIGAAWEVHGQLGQGYVEAVYQEALAMEFVLRGIPFVREMHVPVLYKGRRLASSYRADFVCHGSVVIELKALGALSRKDDVQLMSYLKATGHFHGLLFNFGVPRLQFKRLHQP